MKKVPWDVLALLSIIIVYLAITTYNLRALPGEWYGDISIEHEEVRDILAGHWPWRFNTSAGPAYHYVVAAFAYFLGPRYETYKLASLVTGLVVVLLTYVLGKEFAGKWVGLLSAAVAATAFWLIVFARLGSSPQILSPVLCAASVYFLMLFNRSEDWLDLTLSMIFAGLGLVTYPATFVLPIVVIAVIGWRLVFFRRRWFWLRALVLAFALMVPFTLWFVTLARADADFSQAGYVGSKIFAAGASPQKTALTFGKNMLKAVGMFQFVGDTAFRTNASGSPVLDPLSGVLMDIGLLRLFLDRRLRPRWAYLIAPILILLTPSAEPGVPPLEVPSASRALGAAPFIFLLVALGLEAVWLVSCRVYNARSHLLADVRAVFRSVKTAAPGVKKLPTVWRGLARAMTPNESLSGGVRFASLFAALLLALITFFNVSKYFGAYAWGLPEHNQPWGWQIAQFIDTLPASTEVKLAACCWGVHGQPEPKGIYYVLQHPQGRGGILSKTFLRGCQDLRAGKSYAIIFPPNSDSLLANEIRGCFPNAIGSLHHDGLGKPAFYVLLIK